MPDGTGNEVIDALTVKTDESTTGKTGTETQTATPTPNPLDNPVTQVVNGVEITKTMKEWLQDAQKGIGAEQKFQEAALGRKAVTALKVLATSQDPDEIRAARGLLADVSGLSQEERAALFGSEEEEVEIVNTPNPQNVNLVPAVEAQNRITGQILDATLQAQVTAVLDSDPELAKYLSGDLEPDVKTARRQFFNEKITAAALALLEARTASEGKLQLNWFPQAVQTARAEALKAAKIIGTPSHVGRAPETIAGLNVSQYKDPPKDPPKNASKTDMEKFIADQLRWGFVTDLSNGSA